MLPTVTIGGKSIHNVCDDAVIEASELPLASRPMLRVFVWNRTHAMFAVTITLPYGELTVIPAPGVWLTEDTAPATIPA